MSLRSGLIGRARDWLPSRRSVESQRGAERRRLLGQVRSVRSSGVNPV